MKIDLSKLENYENMTLEEKIKALESYEIEEPKADYTGWVKKEVLDNATKDASEWKKKYQDTLSEAEKKEAEEKESKANIEKELAELRKEKAVNLNLSKLIALGYDEKLAMETANAMYDGNFDKVLENQKKFTEAFEKKLKAEELKGFQRPGATKNEGEQGLTKEQFNQMSLAEKTKLFTEDRETYDKMIGGN